MQQSYTAPSTIAGIKRLAKALKREHGIALHEAQTRAAQIAGFKDLRYAQLQLAGRIPRSSEEHRLFISVYWSDITTGLNGRETRATMLPMPFDSMTNTRAMRLAWGLDGFRRIAADHIQLERIVGRQVYAWGYADSAEQTLQFIAATGLLPANGVEVMKSLAPQMDVFPGNYFKSTWVERLTGHVVSIAEPARGTIAEYEFDRAQWADRHGKRILALPWEGLFFTGEEKVFLISAASGGLDLNDLAVALNRMPPAGSKHLYGESGAYRPLWKSPAGLLAGNRISAPWDPESCSH